MATRLNAARIETLFADGLHDAIVDFIVENSRLGTLIGEQYLF